MVNEAEKYKEEDENQRERIVAKNGLESYAFNVKNTLDETNAKEILSADNINLVRSKCDDTLKWLDANEEEDKDTFKEQQKHLENIVQPVMMKLHKSNGTKHTYGNTQEPTVEEVD